MKKHILFFFIVIVTFSSCVSTLHVKEVAKRNHALPGQTAPYDMVFVEGNKNMPSFYMGIQEESNINYMIYLQWLLSVYGADYPKVVYNALPYNDGDTINRYVCKCIQNNDFVIIKNGNKNL